VGQAFKLRFQPPHSFRDGHERFVTEIALGPGDLIGV